jgi:dTDP-4-dehydrorhamnose 3,5-epimerase
MEITSTFLSGAKIVTPTPAVDARGFFARTWCARTFSKFGLDSAVTQESISFNHCCGTLRGMHFQADPYSESKLVRCTRGAVFDVIVDVRSDSPTYRQWFAIELTQDNRKALFIPKGFAHGFQTLTDDAEVFYQISAEYVAEAARGFNFCDPSVGINWPLPVSVISERDKSLPMLM